MKNNIKALRNARGMTQADLAALTGVGVSQVSKWETGMVDIPMSRLVQIAAALSVREDTLTNPNYIAPGSGSVGIVRGPEDWRGPMPSLGEPAFDNAPPARQRAAEDRPKPNASVVKLEGASQERMLEDLPIYGTALGAARQVDGEAIEQVTLNTAETIAYVKRPVILNGHGSAYALYVTGHSMEPRHMDGEMLIVDPKARVRIMDDVVVYLRPENPELDNGQEARAVLVKRLLRRSSGYIELEQFQPAKQFRIDAADVLRIDRVVPWQELLA
ncbi:LexA family transcriptional regulator [Sphingomonas sp. BK069]|uniref:LexA family transcriptional regulator n=1 Tax=Sphingomonas sp. BK069 TaxID=2586979 RepID=UPI0016164799|nr:LexA family transcriptional regulator [Sphingomonas sp. BK069]MBB3347339.1 phage repressor protein C with HTH and peptisase S24 domain/DNA-binding XRE family transcriptional regulator [Sphingomonas sp. BK069]